MSILGVHPWEFLVIAVVLLVVVGPDQIPAVAQRFGKIVGDARRVTSGLRDDFVGSMQETEDLLTGNSAAVASRPQLDDASPAEADEDEPVADGGEKVDPEQELP